MNIKFIFTLLFITLLSSCTSIIRTDEDSNRVRLFFLEQVVDKSLITNFDRNCSHVGEVIGSEGHWYTYLFISNTHLTQGALNDMKNRAHNMGANTVLVFQNINFVTSVTLLGQAFSCSRHAI